MSCLVRGKQRDQKKEEEEKEKDKKKKGSEFWGSLISSQGQQNAPVPEVGAEAGDGKALAAEVLVQRMGPADEGVELLGHGGQVLPEAPEPWLSGWAPQKTAEPDISH